MARGAAKEQAMGDLHQKVAEVFLRVLQKYETFMDLADTTRNKTAEEEAVNVLLDMDPNPAMMGAITRFLKDNEIAFDTEELEKLSDTEQRLRARKEKRGQLINLGQLALVEPHE